LTSLVKTSHGYYKLRLRVYKELVPYFNRQELNKSLKTKDIKKAKLKARKILNEYHTIKSYCELNKTSETFIIQLCKDFIENTLELNSINREVSKPHQYTYEEVIEDFCIYYNSKEISNETKQAVTSFLKTVYIHLIAPKSKVQDTTLKDLIKIKNLITNLPSRNYKQYKYKSIEELMKLDIPDNHKLSFGRVQTYIKYIKKFFKYCQSHKIITYNPAEYITMSSSLSPIDEREDYTKEEVSKLINIIESFEDDNKRVIYLTLIYTGIRLSELWKATIKSDNGIFYFDLTNKNLKLKTKSSYRVIPLHDELVRNDVHKKLSKALSTLKPSSISHYFTDYIKPKISSNNKKVLYSLRHTFATQLKYADVNPIVISELLGHSHEGMTMGRYANRYPINVLKDSIDKLEF